MPTEPMKKQHAVTSFATRLRAACSVYYTNRTSWFALVGILFIPFSIMITVNNNQFENIRHKIQFTKQLINNAENQNSFETAQQKKEFLQSQKKHLETRIERQREVFAFQVPLVMTFLMLSGTFFLIQMRHQFSNPRSLLSPGFALPHLVAGISGILLSTISFSGFAWYWTGASFFNCFALGLFSCAFVINANRYKSRLLAFIQILIPAACFILMMAKSSWVANYIEGHYLLLALAFSLISFVVIALFSRRLMHFDEEQPEYSPLETIIQSTDVFTQHDFKKQEARQKEFLMKLGWSLNRLDWLAQKLLDRATQTDKFNRTLLWQAVRGGQAFIILLFAISGMIMSGLVLFSVEQYVLSTHGKFQLGDVGLPLVLIIPISGLLLIILTTSWVQTRPQLQIELLRPMNRFDFVRSLIRAHLWEVSIVAVPVFVCNVILTIMFHSEMRYILTSIILMFSITLLLICAVPWLISFRSKIPVILTVIMGQVMIMALITDSKFLREIIFSYGGQGLFFISVLIVGILMLVDTKRRWMKTEFGQ